MPETSEILNHDSAMHKGQFLFSKSDRFHLEWNDILINGYHLYTHPTLPCTHLKNKSKELCILGHIYSWKEPKWSNDDIAQHFLTLRSTHDILKELADFSGHYVVIYKSQEAFIITGDACHQMEIFYSQDMDVIGSQPKLIHRVEDIIWEGDTTVDSFYTSREFLSNMYFINDRTHDNKIKRLLPNHYLDILKGKVVRFFPSHFLMERETQVVAKQVAIMLKGVMRAIAHRNKIALALTAGYDSRMLFLASLDTECSYYISQFGYMDDHHHDITVPKKLTQIFNKKFKIWQRKDRSDLDHSERFDQSIDFPNYPQFFDNYPSHYILLNGFICEIAKNYFGSDNNHSGKDLAGLMGYGGNAYASALYQSWLDDNRVNFTRYGYHYLDIFYWESNASNILAKQKTEARITERSIISPFNCRALIALLLSTPRQDRDYLFSNLFDQIIENLAPGVHLPPINPGWKRDVVGIIKKLGLYPFFKKWRVRMA